MFFTLFINLLFLAQEKIIHYLLASNRTERSKKIEDQKKNKKKNKEKKKKDMSYKRLVKTLKEKEKYTLFLSLSIQYLKVNVADR